MPDIRFLTNSDHISLSSFFEETSMLLRTRTTQRFIDCIYEHLNTPFDNLRIAAIFDNDCITAICIGCTATFLWKGRDESFPEEYKGVFTIPWIQGLPNTIIPRKDKSKLITLVMEYFYKRGLKTTYIIVPWPGNVGKHDIRKIDAVLRSNGHSRSISHSTVSVRAVLNSFPDQKNIPEAIRYLFFHNTNLTYPQAIIRMDLTGPFFDHYKDL